MTTAKPAPKKRVTKKPPPKKKRVTDAHIRKGFDAWAKALRIDPAVPATTQRDSLNRNMVSMLIERTAELIAQGADPDTLVTLATSCGNLMIGNEQLVADQAELQVQLERHRLAQQEQQA